MTLLEDLCRWYRCTPEAAQHILDRAARKGQSTAPVGPTLKDIAEAAGMPYLHRRNPEAGVMTLSDVQAIIKARAQMIDELRQRAQTLKEAATS